MTVASKLTTLALGSFALALVATTAMADRRGDGPGHEGGAAFIEMDFAAMDADKDGKVTPAEIEAARTARMAAADTDGDGFYSAEELAAMQMSRMQARSGEMAARMIARQDADGDGKLSVAEMAPRTGAERMFARIDTDKDGALSQAELTAAKDRMADGMGGEGGKHGKHGNGHHGKGNRGGLSDQGNN